MASISTDYSTIGVASAAAAASSISQGEQDFATVLASQLQDESSTSAETSAAAASADADLALTSYSSGQAVASAASSASTTASEEAAGAGQTETTAASTASATDQTETTTTAAATSSSEESSETSAEETGETSETASTGWPVGVGEEWTPSNMQFFDELAGQWVDDNIPHRLNAEGKLEYYWEGEWYLDTAVRHRVLTDGEATQVAEGETTGEDESTLTEAAYSLEGDGPFTAEEYYNTALNDWALFNLPYRENEDGSREYYWADQWWQDSWDHRAAA